MKFKRRVAIAAAFCIVVVLGFAGPADAQDITIPNEYGKVVKSAEALGALGADAGQPLEVLTGQTERISSGWVFFYDSIAHIRSQDPLEELAGNGPIFIDDQGGIRLLSSATSWQSQLGVDRVYGE